MTWRDQPRWKRTCRTDLARILRKNWPRGSMFTRAALHPRSRRRRRAEYISGVMLGKLGYHRSAFVTWKQSRNRK